MIATILVFFYRQAVQEFRILQTDSLEKVPNLLLERCPVVIYPFACPMNLWTYSDIEQRKSLGAFPIQGVPLGKLIEKINVFMPVKEVQSTQLAKEAGLSIWAEHEILPLFKSASVFGSMYSVNTQTRIGSQGLQKTYAHATLLVCTEGTMHVTLLTEASDPFLPHVWKERRLSKMTRDDAPLIGQIQTVEVIVRQGSALVIPPHWKVCWDDEEDTKPSLAVWIEVHYPVSRFVKHVETLRRA